MVLGVAFDHLAWANLEVRRTCENHRTLLYYPNSFGGHWVNPIEQHHYIFVNGLIRNLNNHLCMFMILEKLMLVPYLEFYGSFYAYALLQPPTQREYASQEYYNLILGYIPRNRIHCVRCFHHGFLRDIDFKQAIRIDPSTSSSLTLCSLNKLWYCLFCTLRKSFDFISFLEIIRHKRWENISPKKDDTLIFCW